ncbi:MAG: hypothetical protein LC649_09930 [Bacteroidales bacterium]|nr:hypothetical protein [Bacteroidales bacterium]
MIDPEKYLRELAKHVDSESILVIYPTGHLVRVYCPFSVIVVIEVGELKLGNIYFVEAVKVSRDLKDVYLIFGKGYLINSFMLNYIIQ